MELSEHQYNTLKTLCESGVYLVIIPDIIPEDPDAIKTNHKHHSDTFTSLTEMGFAENVTDKFEEIIKEVQEEQRKLTGSDNLLRGFTAFVLTEQALRLFSAPGRINQLNFSI